MWHIVHDQIMYIHELLLCNPCESLDPMQDIFRMVTLQLLKLDLNGRERIFVYYHVHSSFPFFQIKISTKRYGFWADQEDLPLGILPLYFDLGSLMHADPRGKRIEGYFSPSTT